MPHDGRDHAAVGRLLLEAGSPVDWEQGEEPSEGIVEIVNGVEASDVITPNGIRYTYRPAGDWRRTMSRAAWMTLAGTLLLAGCSSEAPQPTAPISVPVVTQPLHSPTDSANANGGNFGTPLSSAEEVMPAGVTNDSQARGNGIFALSADGSELSYKLIVANIHNAFMAHIHMAPVGTNGPIAVWLYPSTATVPGPVGGGRLDGVIAEGTITAANLVGPLAGQPLSALVDALKNGGAYVNVHTNDGVAPTNTGPGDFPGGEIRGQLEHRGH
jgi:hypothetical protein